MGFDLHIGDYLLHVHLFSYLTFQGLLPLALRNQQVVLSNLLQLLPLLDLSQFLLSCLLVEQVLA